MDDKLIPMMIWMLVIVLAGAGYAAFSFWKSRRGVAWNVANAALTLRTLNAGQRAAVEQSVSELLPGIRMEPSTFQAAPPAVRLAVYSMAMQRQGVPPYDAAHPFRPLGSPHLARSAGKHIDTVKILVELKHGINLTELEETPVARSAAHPAPEQAR